MKLRIFFVWFLIFFSASCAAKVSRVDDYMLNPEKLEQTLARCPQQHPEGVSCDKLARVAAAVNRLTAELQMSPQAYGLSILTLQTTLAQQLATEKQQPSSQLQQQIAYNQRTLRERLSVIKWLESPKRVH